MSLQTNSVHETSCK